jgi:hypothetical protein
VTAKSSEPGYVILPTPGSEVVVAAKPSEPGSIPPLPPEVAQADHDGKRFRVIEQGLLAYPEASIFWVQAEGFPLWLLSMDRSFVKRVHLLGGANAGTYLQVVRDQGFDHSLINLAIRRIGLARVHFSNQPKSPSPGDIVLISGSIKYIRKHSNHAVNPTLVICTDHIRGKVTKLGGTFRWFHLPHSSFGGSTSFKAFLGTNVEHFAPKTSILRRVIAHILDHGI